MAGKTPDSDAGDVEPPKTKYRVTFLTMRKVFEVDPAALPYGRHGLAGSILDISEAAGVSLDHSCGGGCACSTCHVIRREGVGSCNEATDDQLDQVAEARGVEVPSPTGSHVV